MNEHRVQSRVARSRLPHSDTGSGTRRTPKGMQNVSHFHCPRAHDTDKRLTGPGNISPSISQYYQRFLSNHPSRHRARCSMNGRMSSSAVHSLSLDVARTGTRGDARKDTTSNTASSCIVDKRAEEKGGHTANDANGDHNAISYPEHSSG